MLREVKENINIISNKITNIETQTNELWDITNYISENLKNVKYTHLIHGNIVLNPDQFIMTDLSTYNIEFRNVTEYCGDIVIPYNGFTFEDIVQVVVRTRQVLSKYYWNTSVVYKFAASSTYSENWITGLIENRNALPTINDISGSTYLSSKNYDINRQIDTHMQVRVINDGHQLRITDQGRQYLSEDFDNSGLSGLTDNIITREFCDYIILINKDLVLTEKKLQDRLLPPLFLFSNKGGNKYVA